MDEVFVAMLGKHRLSAPSLSDLKFTASQICNKPKNRREIDRLRVIVANGEKLSAPLTMHRCNRIANGSFAAGVWC